MSETIEPVTTIAVIPETSTAITVIPAASLPVILSADKNDILGKLREKVMAHKPDISTVKGRAEIASLAATVASSKMDLIRLGKSLTEGWRAQTKAVNEECNIIEEKMDALKAEVRRPLTEYENAEKGRVKAHEDALAEITEAPGWGVSETSTELQERLDYLQNYPPRKWQEFSQRAADTLASEIAKTSRLLDAVKSREAEARELERLRAMQAERDKQEALRQQAERVARIAAEAAERAKVAAEHKAAKEAAEAARRSEAARLKAEQDAAAEMARIEREAQAAMDAAKREQERIQAEARAAEDRAAKSERDRVAAEADAVERARIAAEKAERDRERAVENERKRIAAEQRAAEESARKREADIAHRGKIMRAAKEGIMEHAGLDEETAKTVMIAIKNGFVPHVRIEF